MKSHLGPHWHTDADITNLGMRQAFHCKPETSNDRLWHFVHCGAHCDCLLIPKSPGRQRDPDAWPFARIGGGLWPRQASSSTCGGEDALHVRCLTRCQISSFGRVTDVG